MWNLIRNFLIVPCIFVSCISCGDKNLKRTDEHIYKGKLYISNGDSSVKTLFYLKTDKAIMTMSIYSQFGDTICDIVYDIIKTDIDVRSVTGDMDSDGLKKAAMLLLPILNEKDFSKPVQTEEGTVTFSNFDEKGFAKTWVITTSSFSVKVIFK